MRSTTTTPKLQRADAQRNYEMLLEAGKSIFARSGTDAPLEEVARAAGVGKGTLYRHFPTREHLFVAILQDQVDYLNEKAIEFQHVPDAWQALVEWLHLYDRSLKDYRGLSARMGDGLADDGSPVAKACAPMRKSFALLFERAKIEAGVRSDITAVQVLTMIGALPKDPQTGETDTPYLDIVLRGLRA